MIRKFDKVAQDSVALQRLLAHLCTSVGLAKIRTQCIDQGVQPHGTGHGEAGIAECRAIYAELERCKAEGLPAPAAVPDASFGGVVPTSCLPLRGALPATLLLMQHQSLQQTLSVQTTC